MEKSSLKKLKNIIENDSISHQNKLTNLIKSDVYLLLKNYFEMDEEDVFLDIKSGENGIEIDIKATGKTIKNHGDFQE